jgi:hypothetical protein
MPRDGQAPPTANLPMGNFKLTGLANGSAAADSVAFGQLTTLQGQVQGSSLTYLGSVAGTNTVTATLSGLAAYALGQRFTFIPAVTNTGATTINISSLGAKNVFLNGAACIGGELVAGTPVDIVYDGTQFQICGGNALGVAIGSFTRDVSLAGGTQAVTGVGFRPRAVFLLANIASTAAMSAGMAAGATNAVLYDNGNNAAGTYNNNGTNAVLLLTASAQAATAGVTSIDADGFTVTWAKSGSPTGTATVRYLALR